MSERFPTLGFLGRSGHSSRSGGAAGPPHGPGPREAAIATVVRTEGFLDPQCLRYTDAFVAEHDAQDGARLRAEAIGDDPIGQGAGAALRFLAAVLDARSVVEIGTGTGLSGTWLLRGMRPDGVLTSIDADGERHRLARETFNAAGVPANRARLITGRPQDVLPRLTDGAYDLVFAGGEPAEYADHLREASRLLRPGGVVAFDGALAEGAVLDPARRDPATVAVRDLGRALLEHEAFTAVLLPVGAGLLCAAKRAPR
jgi:predicted O-methyltransferase YrrM